MLLDKKKIVVYNLIYLYIYNYIFIILYIFIVIFIYSYSYIFIFLYLYIYIIVRMVLLLRSTGDSQRQLIWRGLGMLLSQPQPTRQPTIINNNKNIPPIPLP